MAGRARGKRATLRGVPTQVDTDVWPIVSDEGVVDAVADGSHDACIRALRHVALSQGIDALVAACDARISALEG